MRLQALVENALAGLDARRRSRTSFPSLSDARWPWAGESIAAAEAAALLMPTLSSCWDSGRRKGALCEGSEGAQKGEAKRPVIQRPSFALGCP